MDERQIAWYRLRGLGLTCLCSLVFFIGAYVANEKSVAVSGQVEQTGLPVCSVETDEKQIALTFDAMQEKGSLDSILNTLKSCGVKASFFVTGQWVEAFPDEVQAIAADGHDIGNYSQSYQEMTGMTRKEIQQEIQTLHEKVWELAHVEMKLFRAPYGKYDTELIDTVKQSGYLPISWSIDSQDWKEYGANDLIRTILQDQNLEEGAILRFHCSSASTAEALPELISALQEQGYELVPVSQMI
jgi:peptidoglycan/xylan/chitin deacetylase (PgdA/CDA1 family)